MNKELIKFLYEFIDTYMKGDTADAAHLKAIIKIGAVDFVNNKLESRAVSENVIFTALVRFGAYLNSIEEYKYIRFDFHAHDFMDKLKKRKNNEKI